VLYRLDAVGNRTGEREAQSYAGTLDAGAFAGATNLNRDVTAVFDRADWLRSRSDSVDHSRDVTFSYDLNGNLIHKQQATTIRELRWDARNTLTAILENGSELGRYDYCYSGLRVKRSAQGQQVEYVLDDKFVLSEHDGSSAGHSMKRRYHYGAAPLADSEVSGASRFTTWFSLDAQGSVTDATQSDGAVRSGRQYDAWGQYRSGTAPRPDEPKLGYTGHQYDAESRLVYARARYYDSETGTFLSRDRHESLPIDAPRLNRYVYAANNPLVFIDENGRWWTAADWKNSGLAFAGAVYGAGKVLASPGVLTYYATGNLLYKLTGDETYADQAKTFTKGAEALVDAFSSPEKAKSFVVQGLIGGLKRAEAAIDRGDAFAAGEGAGEFAMQTALIADAGSGIKLNVQSVPVLAGAGQVARATLRLAVTATGPNLPPAAIAMANMANEGGEQQGASSSGNPEKPVTESESSPGGERSRPPERYNRQQHYGGAQTDTPAGRAVRAAGEGQSCPTCGEPQVSGTKTAPVPEHDPSLLEHYYERGGHEMTDAERRAYAGSEEAFNGTRCLTCQRKQGADLARLSKEYAKTYGLVEAPPGTTTEPPPQTQPPAQDQPISTPDED